MSQCQVKICDHEATTAVAVNVPAMHCPIPEHEPLQIVLGLKVCDECFAEMEPAEFFEAEGKLEQLFRMMARGKAEPDFKRAFLTKVSFESKEWIALTTHKENAGKKSGGSQ